jgi:hypothetical protein
VKYKLSFYLQFPHVVDVFLAAGAAPWKRTCEHTTSYNITKLMNSIGGWPVICAQCRQRVCFSHPRPRSSMDAWLVFSTRYEITRMYDALWNWSHVCSAMRFTDFTGGLHRHNSPTANCNADIANTFKTCSVAELKRHHSQMEDGMDQLLAVLASKKSIFLRPPGSVHIRPSLACTRAS